MDLPQELVDMILDNIRDDIPSLESCSLVARAFVASARKHIFKKTEVLSSSDACQRFYKLLSSSPHIALLVKDLCIVSVFPETPVNADSYGGYMAGRTLSLILPLLDLTRISIVENGSTHHSGMAYSRSWDKMEQTLKSALASVFSSPRLEAVHLRGLVLESPRQLLSLFSKATALKELSLSRLYFTQHWSKHERWPESQLWNPKLQSLLVNDFYTCGFSQYFVHPQIDLTNVRTLTVATHFRKQIIRATNRGLPGGVEHLSLWVAHDIDGLSPEFFSINLRSIHLFSHSIIEQLGTVFKRCPHDSCLERVILDGPGDVQQIPQAPEFYAAINTAVGYLCSLKTIEMRPIMAGLSDTFGQWETAVQSVFPSLVRRGMLRITEIEGRGDDVDPDWE